MEQENLIFGVKPYKEKAKEGYMNPKQLDHFEKILINWQASLMQEVDQTVHKMQSDENIHADPVDRASKEEEFTLELRTRDRERKLLRKINDSLDDIKRGDYGYCHSCGAEIGIRRLEARPIAEMCVDCKTITEQKEIHI